MSYSFISNKYLWFLHKKVTLFEGDGVYSKLKVTKTGDRLDLFTGGKYLQTTLRLYQKPFGSFFDWYLAAPWFSGNFNNTLDSLLILGLGGGSQVKNFNRIYTVNKIVGIEVDPLIIELGKKYFELNDENLTAVVADAYDYVTRDNLRYDLIIVDLFKENVSDDQKQSQDFINSSKALLTENGVLFINRLKEDETNPQLEKHLLNSFKSVYTLEVFLTKFYIATDSADSPKSVNDVKQLFKSNPKKNPNLKFMSKNTEVKFSKL